MKKWNIYILALLLLSACAEEEQIVPDIGGNTTKDDSGLTINLKFSQASPATYALMATEENRIESLEILVFTGGGTTNALDDKFAYSIQVPSGSITDSVSSGSIKKVPVSLQSMKDEKQRMILLANKPAEVVLSPTDTVGGVTKLGDIINKLQFSGQYWRKDNLSASDPAFPMWGQMADSILFHPTNTLLPSKIEINMMRAVAKIDIGVDVNGNDPALGFGKVFKIDSIFLCNASDSGSMVPHSDYLKNKPLITSANVEKTNHTNKRVEYTGYKYKEDASSNSMVRTIYTPESDTLNGSYKPTFLVIKAEYYNEPYYYRIDFANNGKYVPLLRNNSYLINILGVRSKGYKLLHEALNAPVTSHNYSLILDESELVINEVITNEQYMLGYSSSYILLDWNQSLDIPILTDYTGGWTASATGDVTFSGKIGGSGNITNLTHTLTNNLTVPREFTVHLSAGTLNSDITVIQGIGSNSYMVTPSGKVQIPVNSANLAGDILSGSSDVNVKVLWQNNASVSFSGKTTNLASTDILTVNAGPTSGNVVIALTKKGSGIGMVGGVAADEIIWIWHVWVSTYDASTTTISNNGYIFMDRNLGATSNGTTASAYGAYYQWGRKDPFFVGNFVTEAPPGTLEAAITNPNIFYTSNTSPNDWIGTTQNNNLWNTVDGKKAAYDPCPFGWRVPVINSDTSSPWSGFDKNTRNGITFPLAGGLSAIDGQLSEAGTQGYVWSGSVSNTSARVFKFTSSSAGYSPLYRANAYPVRCIKDGKQL